MNHFSIQQSKAARTCSYCSSKILKGMWSLNFSQHVPKMNISGNICAQCVQFIANNLREKNNQEEQ